MVGRGPTINSTWWFWVGTGPAELEVGVKITPSNQSKCLVAIIEIHFAQFKLFSSNTVTPPNFLDLPPVLRRTTVSCARWNRKIAHKFHWKENSFLLSRESFLKWALLVKIYGLLASTKLNCKKSWPIPISCAYCKKYKSCLKGWLTSLLQFCLTTTWWIPDNCLTTTWWLPDNCMTTAWRLHDD